MVITHLADGNMKQEKKYMGWYGAVRMTKKETEEMVSGNYRNINFWVFATCYDEKEDRGGSIPKMGFKFCRDWGNASYADLLKNRAHKAHADGIINSEDYGQITRYGDNNMGNILGTIMGYAFIAHYWREESLLEFKEIANTLETALITRATEDEEEEEEEAYAEPAGRKEMTKADIMAMNKTMTEGMTDQLDTLRTRLEDITAIQEETKKTMEAGFQAQEKAFDEAHETNSRNRKKLEDEIRSVYAELKKEKRKSNEMDADAEGEPQQDLSDDDEPNLEGARKHDMNRFTRGDVIMWMGNNQEQEDNAAMIFDRNLMVEPDGAMSIMTTNLSLKLYDAVIGNNVAYRKGWHPLERLGSQVLGWYPWGTLKKHLSDPRVWGEDLADKAMWNAITQTRNNHFKFHSFMIKIIRNEWVFIKATSRYFGNKSGAGSQSGGQDDDGNGGGGGYGDGKGRDGQWERHGKGEWKDYSKQAPWTNPGGKGGKRPSKWASEFDDDKQAQKEKDSMGDEKDNAAKRTGTFASQQDPRAFSPKAPEEWFVGQMIPNSYAANGSADTWREVKTGEKCQWSDRIAKCTKEEHQMNMK